jgi:hypothetical protein
MRRLLLLSVVFCLVTSPLQAQQGQVNLSPNNRPPKLDKGVTPKEGALPPAVIMLNVVKVKAPDINCFFNTTCAVTVEDTSSPITIAGAKGSGFLQSRTYKGAPGSRAAGLYVYEYRVDLTGMSADGGKIPTFTSFRISFKDPVGAFDFNNDGKSGDQVFVTTEGGIGNVVPTSAVYDGATITFTFSNPRLPAGSVSSKGQTSFFFGLVSKNPPRNVGVRAVVNEGTGLNLSARAPNF